MAHETNILCGVEEATETTTVIVWEWQKIAPEDELDQPRPGDSPERTVALRMLAGLPNRGSRGVYRRDINYFMDWWRSEYAPALLEGEKGDPRSPINARRQDLEQFLLHLGSLEDPLTKATINRRIAVVSSFYERACEDEDIACEINPCARLKRPKITNDARSGLDAKQAGNLLEAARRWPDRREGTLVILLLLAGLRISEAVSLGKADLIYDGGFFKIAPNRKGKDGRQLLVIDEPDLIARLEELARASDRLFDGMDRFAAGRVVARVGQAAGLKQPLYPHLLRHTFVTQLLRAGFDIETVRVLAGHSSIVTTQRYARAAKTESEPFAGPLAARYEATVATSQTED